MHTTLTTLINRLDDSSLQETDVLSWGSPVPAFGDPSVSRVASLGLNPSNREFVNESGQELEGTSRRFHTLASLGLASWSDIDARHLQLILDSCRMYFLRNPYDRWFKKLDYVLSGTNASFYSPMYPACHLDLIPYATARKWMDLTQRQKSTLLDATAGSLGFLVRDGMIEVLILNGQSVVNRFQNLAGIRLHQERMPDWSLPRERRPNVAGIGYIGTIETLSGISLEKKVLVLGYNHNLQSSFGVTFQVIRAIRDWVAQKVGENKE